MSGYLKLLDRLYEFLMKEWDELENLKMEAYQALQEGNLHPTIYYAEKWKYVECLIEEIKKLQAAETKASVDHMLRQKGIDPQLFSSGISNIIKR
jgi:endonuclease III-like uncharacterized protein